MSRRITRRLVILQHGSHGHAADFTLLSGVLQAAAAKLQPDVKLTIVAPTAAEGPLTRGGTRRCVDLLTTPVSNTLSEFERAVRGDGDSAIGAVTMVGHSYGGVLLRGVLRNLQASGYLDPKSPLQFDKYISVATPHLGIAHTSFALRAIAQRASIALKSTAYRDMLLESDAFDQLAADPDALRALERFDHRIAIATAGDHLVSPSSSLIAPVTLRDVRAVAGAYRHVADAEKALVPMDASRFMPKHIADAGDLYSGFTDLAQWKVATPRLDDTKRRRVAFMAHQLRLAGHWSTYVAAFPIWAKYASHRAVIGKTPYDRPGDANQPHIDSLTALILGGQHT
jgi:hypothetical protein